MFSSFVVGYLFLGGTGAGACVLLALFGLLAPRNRVSTMGMSSRARKPVRLMRAPHAYVQLMAPAFTAACAALVVGALFLMLDLGSVEKALLLFAFPTPTYLTFGAYALALLMAVSLLLSHAWWSGGSRWRYGAVQALHACALVVGIVVMVYTGLLLADMPAVPFWHTAWVPVLFALSAFSCGCALVLACAGFTGALDRFASLFRRVACLDEILLALEASALVARVVVGMSNPYEVAGSAVDSLLAGGYAGAFVGGVLCLGVCFPLVLEVGSQLLKARSTAFALVVSSAVLAGGLMLRYCIVAVGAHPEVWTVVL